MNKTYKKYDRFNLTNNDFEKGLIRDIEKEMKSEKSPERKKLLMQAKEGFELWISTGEVDKNALGRLCIEIGQMKQSKRRRKDAIENKGNAELWAMSEKGDVDATMELSIRFGMAKREDWERIKKRDK